MTATPVSAACTLPVLALAAFLGPGPASGQAAGTLPPLDPVHEDLAFLEAAGLMSGGASALRPLSYARVALIARDARAGWRAGGGDTASARRASGRDPFDPDRARDIEAVLSRLEARFGADGSARQAAELAVDLELGGGHSPARATPDTELGSYGAVVNPVWGEQAGRAYGDRATAATGLRVTAPLSDRLAVGVAVRAATHAATSAMPGRTGVVLEAAYVRVRAGSVALQLGRDAWWHAPGSADALLLSRSAPPLNLLRVGSDGPHRLSVLGNVEWALTASELGPDAFFPHTALFGASLAIAPSSSVRLGFTLLNKQGGQGAPRATLADRLKDLSLVWDFFRRDSVFEFSDKRVGVDARVSFATPTRVELAAELALEDFDHRRLGDVAEVTGAYRLGVSLPSLGTTGRHGLQAVATRTGALMYRHHDFLDGFSVDGHPLGSTLGPGGRRMSVAYLYRAPAQGLSAGVEAAWERRGIDRYVWDPGGVLDIEFAEARPRETRLRLVATLGRRFGARTTVWLRAGSERVGTYAHEPGDDRSNYAALVRIRRVF